MVKKSKILLEKCFIIDKDYKVLLNLQVKQTNDTRGGDNKQTILLNICTFKLFLCKGWNQKSQ